MKPSFSEPRIYYRVEEAGELLGIGRSKMFELVRSGDLPSHKVGKLRRIHADDLRAWASGTLGAPRNP